MIPIQETSYTNTGGSVCSKACRPPVGFRAQTAQKTRVCFVCTTKIEVKAASLLWEREIGPKMKSFLYKQGIAQVIQTLTAQLS